MNLPRSTDYTLIGKLRQIRRTSKGFTLIELLVVVSIIAILALVGLYVIGNVLPASRDSRRRADIQNISRALELQKTNTGSYPALAGTMLSTGAVPADPTSTNVYCYNNSTAATPTVTTAWTEADCIAATNAPGDTGSGWVPVSSWVATQTWKVCARLETGPAAFCLISVQ